MFSLIFLHDFIFMVGITFYNDIRVNLSFDTIIFFFSLTSHKQKKIIILFLFLFFLFFFHSNILMENKNPLNFLSSPFFSLPNTP